MNKFIQFFALLFVFIVILSLGGVFVIYSQLKPIDPQDQTIEKFVVKRGSGASQIAADLVDAGFIRSPLIFRLVVKGKGWEQQLQAGTFELSKGMDVIALASKLTMGTEDVWITIQEGWRKEEIAESVAQQGLSSFDEQEFLQRAADAEGMLFPDTYLVPREISASALYTLLTDTFERKVILNSDINLSESVHTPSEVFIMASLIEREAQSFEDMQQVSGVLWNRIDIGMPLQVDATLQYAKGYSELEQTWWATPLAADKSLESVFNTYLHAQLPPKPISNPGLNAIKAAVYPAKSEYLFYIHDREGRLHLAKTLTEHNQNVQTYLR